MIPESKLDKIVDKIMNLLPLLNPKTEPQTSAETEVLQLDPDIDEKLRTVKYLLESFGLTAASNDIKVSNVKRYALWVLHKAKMNVKLTNPITREVWIDRKALLDYQQIREHLRTLNLLPESHPLLTSEFETNTEELKK